MCSPAQSQEGSKAEPAAVAEMDRVYTLMAVHYNSAVYHLRGRKMMLGDMRVGSCYLWSKLTSTCK